MGLIDSGFVNLIGVPRARGRSYTDVAAFTLLDLRLRAGKFQVLDKQAKWITHCPALHISHVQIQIVDVKCLCWREHLCCTLRSWVREIFSHYRIVSP